MVALALLGSHKYLLPSETASRESFISLASQTENMCKNILPKKKQTKTSIFTFLVLDKSKNVMYLWKSATLKVGSVVGLYHYIISEEPLRLCTGTHTFHESPGWTQQWYQLLKIRTPVSEREPYKHMVEKHILQYEGLTNQWVWNRFGIFAENISSWCWDCSSRIPMITFKTTTVTRCSNCTWKR